MKKQPKEKWYYSVQREVEKYLMDTFKSHRFIWQVISDKRVIENYLVKQANGELQILLIVMTTHNIQSAQTARYSVYHLEH